MASFIEFLNKKRIDAARFQAVLPSLYSKWEAEFSVQGPTSFDHARKFQLNPIRIQFPFRNGMA